MLKIETTAEIVKMSEIYSICEQAGLEPELDELDISLTELLFNEVLYEDGEYRRIMRHNVSHIEADLEGALEENSDKVEILWLRCQLAIQKALKEAGVEDYVLVEIGV